jgi:hypothetical protein
LLHNVCDSGTLHPSIYGGIPGKSSLDPVFIKEMEYELTRLTRHPLLQLDDDLMSCYDMIPVFLANIESRKRGDTGKRTNATFRGIRPKPHCDNTAIKNGITSNGTGKRKWDCLTWDCENFSVTAFYVFFKKRKT